MVSHEVTAVVTAKLRIIVTGLMTVAEGLKVVEAVGLMLVRCQSVGW